MSTPYEAQEWKNDIDAFKTEYGLRGGSVGTPYEIKPWMNEIDALREEIESGGGGSSDFSTATVTVTFVPSTSGGGLPTILGASLPNIVYLGHPDMQYFISSDISGSGGTATFTAVLYQGKAVARSADYYIKNLSGDIEWNDDIGNYIITGDCAFTLSETE